MPGVYRQLIASCWDQDPEKRPTFRQIIDMIKGDVLAIGGVDVEKLRKYQEEMLNALDNQTSD